MKHFNRVELLAFVFVLTSVGAKVQHKLGTPHPSFGDSIQNVTVVKDRDVTFTCIVKNLGQYKVGWVKADTKAIQAIHHQVVTHNPRIKVTWRDKVTWNLHIRSVQPDDGGIYMCQVNTDPMISETAYLRVIVPPEIIDNESSGETEIDEGGSVGLRCKAKGYPTPKVSWQKEGGGKITLRDQGAKPVESVDGEILQLTKIKRKDMGPYLCIATNGVPPSVSKRIMLRVNFKPNIQVPVHMIGSPLGNNVTIVCNIESSPRAVNNWKKKTGHKDSQLVIISSHKYEVIETQEGFYKTKMTLIIKNFTKEDTTNYICSSSNSLGKSESQIQIYDIAPPTKEEKTDEKLEERTNIISSHKKETVLKENRHHKYDRKPKDNIYKLKHSLTDAMGNLNDNKSHQAKKKSNTFSNIDNNIDASFRDTSYKANSIFSGHGNALFLNRFCVSVVCLCLVLSQRYTFVALLVCCACLSVL